MADTVQLPSINQNRGRQVATAAANFAATNRSQMEKKHKLNDGTSKFVEQSTLLDPANRAAAWKEEEEKQEVSVELSRIKKKHDDLKKQVKRMEDELEEVKKQCEQLGRQEVLEDTKASGTYDRIEQLEAMIGSTRDRCEEELMNKHTYAHMLERMNKDIIAMAISKNEMEESLHSKTLILEVENDKSRKTKEAKLQSKSVFDNLMRNIEQEQRDRQERIMTLQKSIRNKEDSVQRRMDRVKRQAEIAEAAANENKDSSEIKMRECLFVQKLWNAFMRKKMDREMRESQGIDEAFKKIKTNTGITDVQEMVHKFLSREQTYSELLEAVAESERKIDHLKVENEQCRGRLHELEIANEGDEAAPVDENVSALYDELATVEKEAHHVSDKYQNIEIVNDQLTSWAGKVQHKFAALFEKGGIDSKDDITEVFETMAQVVCGELEQIIAADAEAQED